MSDIYITLLQDIKDKMRKLEEENTTIRKMLAIREGESLIEEIDALRRQIFSPKGESHHDANKCPYCQEYLNGRS